MRAHKTGGLGYFRKSLRVEALAEMAFKMSPPMEEASDELLIMFWEPPLRHWRNPFRVGTEVWVPHPG